MLIAIAFLVGNPLIQASMYGPVGAYLSELFEPTARYSGVSLTYQVGSLLGAGLAPLVAERLVTDSAGTSQLAWYIVGAYVVRAAAVLLSRRSTIAAEVAAEVAETEEGATAADQAEESRAESAAARG